MMIFENDKLPMERNIPYDRDGNGRAHGPNFDPFYTKF